MMRNLLHAANPLRCTDKSLPPVLVVVAKILALVLIIRGDQPFELYLPYFEFIDSIAAPELFHLALRGMTYTGFVLLFFTPLLRSGCLLVGAAFLIGLLSCRPCLSVAHTYVAALFIILALSSNASGSRLLRLQVVMLYAGACLNKLRDADWWNGQYFETLMVTRHAHELYIATAALFPPMMLSTVMGIITIFVQLALSICFLRRSWYNTGIVLGLTFHGVMIILMNGTFGPFFMAIVISYLAFVEWPEQIQISSEGSVWKQRLQKALSAIDFDRLYHKVHQGGAGPSRLQITLNGRSYYGFAAFQLLVFYNPIIMAFAAFVLTESHFGVFRRFIVLFLLVFFSPLMTRFVEFIQTGSLAKATK